MRLFVAADIDDQTRARLQLARDAMIPVIGRAAVPPRITWVKEGAAHVTLRFIGEVPDATAVVLQQRFERPLSVAPFDVKWDRVGTFPAGRRPRVVWIGTSAGEKLVALAEVVNARIANLAGSDVTRPLKPHVTIGRVKDAGKGVDWLEAVSAAKFSPTMTRVDHVTLYLSRQSSKGSTYTPLCTSALHFER